MRVLTLLLLTGLAAGEPVELLRCTFDRPLDSPCLSIVDTSKVAEGALLTESLANWKRCGLEVGPLPMTGQALTIVYDFKPVRFGRQSQSFVSQKPSTHGYMLYARAGGSMNLHTRHQGKWMLRAHSKQILKLGQWYHARVRLSRESVLLAISNRESGKVVWETGPVPMDSLGESTTFILTDEDSAAASGSLAQELMDTWHAPFGQREEQGFWRDSRDAEPRLAASPGQTIADLEESPGISAGAERLLGFCKRARSVIERWKSKALRNHSTLDFLLHDVHIYETLARRFILLNRLKNEYAGARAEKNAQALLPFITGLESLARDYSEFERMFQRSIREAGGGVLEKASYQSGLIRFRAVQGRQGLRKLANKLQALDANAEWPRKP